jgi:hypothetical protein
MVVMKKASKHLSDRYEEKALEIKESTIETMLGSSMDTLNIDMKQGVAKAIKKARDVIFRRHMIKE